MNAQSSKLLSREMGGKEREINKQASDVDEGKNTC
jgi:hypothetical protein